MAIDDHAPRRSAADRADRRSAAGSTCSRRSVVPTAPTHQVRRPYIIRPAQRDGERRRRATPPAATDAAFDEKQPRGSPRVKSRSRAAMPICASRCSMPSRKNSAARSSAETIRKKLKYEKYAPKSVAPTDAAASALGRRRRRSRRDPADRRVDRRGAGDVRRRRRARSAEPAGCDSHRRQLPVARPPQTLPGLERNERFRRRPELVASTPRRPAGRACRSIGNGGSQSATLVRARDARVIRRQSPIDRQAGHRHDAGDRERRRARSSSRPSSAQR